MAQPSKCTPGQKPHFVHSRVWLKHPSNAITTTALLTTTPHSHPSFFLLLPTTPAAIFNGTTCGQHFGVLSIALGMDAASLPIPGVTVPSSPADVQTALGAYCPSYCSFAVKALAAEYQAKPSNGRLCPQVLDGTWRLNMACDKMGSDYCLPTYQTITAAFDGKGDSTVTGDQLDGMCSNHCTRMIQDDAQAAAAKIGSKMVPGDMSDNGVLQDYAFRRASSINRMVDVLCTRDVADGQVCAAKTNLLSRLDTSVGSEGPIVITPAPPAASSAPSAASSSSSRALAADGQDISGQDDSQSDDSLATLLNPKLRPGFACTFCGHNILSGLLDLADIFGNNLPAGGSSLTVDRIRTMLEHGCPVYNGRTCMQMLAFSSPASTSYDPTLGMAVQGLQLCASEMASGMATCSESCKYALNAANDAFGCCFGHALEMKVALGDMPALNVMTIVNAAKSSCGVDFVSRIRDDALLLLLLLMARSMDIAIAAAPSRNSSIIHHHHLATTAICRASAAPAWSASSLPTSPPSTLTGPHRTRLPSATRCPRTTHASRARTHPSSRSSAPRALHLATAPSW